MDSEPSIHTFDFPPRLDQAEIENRCARESFTWGPQALWLLWGLIWLVALVGGALWLCGSSAVLDSAYLQSVVLSSVGIIGFTVLCWLLLGVLPERRAHRFAGRLGRIPKVGHSLAEFWRAVWLYRSKPRGVAGALLLAILGHVGKDRGLDVPAF